MKWAIRAALLLALSFAGPGSALSARPLPEPVREPAVAGRFYPSGARELRGALEAFLRDAVPPGTARPLAILAPHAGYLFSGQIAADAFRQASGHRYDLVVLLGANHTSPGLRGVALHPGSGFRTPLGVAEIDRDAAQALAAEDPDCVWDAEAHAQEHSVEVQVPFVQAAFPGARILPVVVGEPDPGLCSRLGVALARVVRRRNALIVASSDLSHYPSAEDAREVDRKVLSAIASLDADALRRTIRAELTRGGPSLATCACGEAPILGALAAARALGATRGTLVSYAHSGDTVLGERGRVVGYGAVAFFAGAAPSGEGHPKEPPKGEAAGDLDGGEQRALLAFARETIRRYLATGTVPLPRGLSPRLGQNRGAFVTLKKGGELRGCIGRMSVEAPLSQTVGAMALQAALRDPRFPPVSAAELPDLEVEVSVLTPSTPIREPGEILVGRDGVILEKAGRSAVFLPQVAVEQGWKREEMLEHLCRKAGLPAGSWKDGARLSTFRAQVFQEGKGVAH